MLGNKISERFINDLRLWWRGNPTRYSQVILQCTNESEINVRFKCHSLRHVDKKTPRYSQKSLQVFCHICALCEMGARYWDNVKEKEFSYNWRSTHPRNTTFIDFHLHLHFTLNVMNGPKKKCFNFEKGMKNKTWFIICQLFGQTLGSVCCKFLGWVIKIRSSLKTTIVVDIHPYRYKS